jgi:uncharacterized protein YndB with AHSA1/START domain
MPVKSRATSAPAAALEREVIITRIFDAPRSLVFKAWTDPKHIQRWWGPKGFTNPFCELDVRVGGAWRIVMRGPNSVDYPGSGVYREIVEPERLVFTNIAEDQEGNTVLDGITTVTFAEQGGKTKLTLQTRAVAMVAGAEAYLAGMEAGWTQSLERLEEELMEGRELVFTRVFDAPRELLFEVWTDPNHLARWWGPRGFTITSLEMDARPGGMWRLIMHGPDGVDYKNRIVYLEVARPERLVYKHAGEEKDEAVRFTVTVTFEEAAGKTRLTMRMVFDSAQERDHVVRTYGAEQGAMQTLERLREHLATIA